MKGSNPKKFQYKSLKKKKKENLSSSESSEYSLEGMKTQKGFRNKKKLKPIKLPNFERENTKSISNSPNNNENASLNKRTKNNFMKTGESFAPKRKFETTRISPKLISDFQKKNNYSS